MALIKCGKCAGEFPRSANECPKCGSKELPFAHVAWKLAWDPLVVRALKKAFGKPEAVRLISQLKDEVFDDALCDFLVDLLQNEGRLYMRFTARGVDEGRYQIDVRGLGGVYYARADQFAASRYFISLEDAEGAVRDLVAYEKMSHGRRYREAFDDRPAYDYEPNSENGASRSVLVERADPAAGSKTVDRIRLKCAQGGFTVLAERAEKDPSSHRNRWFALSQTEQLEEPSAILAAVQSAAQGSGIRIEWREVIPKIASVDWVVAAVIAQTTKNDLPPLPDVDAVPEQRSFKALGRVRIGVEWGYDIHSLSVSLKEWIRIANGGNFWDTEPYLYEGKKFIGSWSFGGRKLEVSYQADNDSWDIEDGDDEDDGGYSELGDDDDDAGEGWVGHIDSVDELDGPKVEGMDIAHLARAAGGQ